MTAGETVRHQPAPQGSVDDDVERGAVEEIEEQPDGTQPRAVPWYNRTVRTLRKAKPHSSGGGRSEAIKSGSVFCGIASRIAWFRAHTIGRHSPCVMT